MVAADDSLFTVEAMKMQTIVRAAAGGTVKRIALDVGTRVDVGDLVIELELELLLTGSIERKELTTPRRDLNNLSP